MTKFEQMTNDWATHDCRMSEGGCEGCVEYYNYLEQRKRVMARIEQEVGRTFVNITGIESNDNWPTGYSHNENS